MLVTRYIALMLAAVVGTAVAGLSLGWSGWQTAAAAAAVLVVGQLALLGYVAILAFGRSPSCADPQDTLRADPDYHPAPRPRERAPRP